MCLFFLLACGIKKPWAPTQFSHPWLSFLSSHYYHNLFLPQKKQCHVSLRKSLLGIAFSKKIIFFVWLFVCSFIYLFNQKQRSHSTVKQFGGIHLFHTVLYVTLERNTDFLRANPGRYTQDANIQRSRWLKTKFKFQLLDRLHIQSWGRSPILLCIGFLHCGLGCVTVSILERCWRTQQV